MVEIYSQTPDGEDWDFCLDNVIVEFNAKKKEEVEEDIVPARMHVALDVV